MHIDNLPEFGNMKLARYFAYDTVAHDVKDLIKELESQCPRSEEQEKDVDFLVTSLTSIYDNLRRIQDSMKHEGYYMTCKFGRNEPK